MSADRHLVISLAVVAAVASVIVVLWTTTIETLREHERRITALEEKVQNIIAKEEIPR